MQHTTITYERNQIHSGKHKSFVLIFFVGLVHCTCVSRNGALSKFKSVYKSTDERVRVRESVCVIVAISSIWSEFLKIELITNTWKQCFDDIVGWSCHGSMQFVCNYAIIIHSHMLKITFVFFASHVILVDKLLKYLHWHLFLFIRCVDWRISVFTIGVAWWLAVTKLPILCLKFGVYVCVIWQNSIETMQMMK